jgi:hypothetical protein
LEETLVAVRCDLIDREIGNEEERLERRRAVRLARSYVDAVKNRRSPSSNRSAS